MRDLTHLADKLGCSITQLTIAWCLKSEQVQCVLLGALSVDHLYDQLQALQIIPKLTTNISNEIEKILDNKPTRHPCRGDWCRVGVHPWISARPLNRLPRRAGTTTTRPPPLRKHPLTNRPPPSWTHSDLPACCSESLLKYNWTLSFRFTFEVGAGLHIKFRWQVTY
ncbi:voltage-gated potassium channel subunit beta-2 [Caerostris extrusa]|uniref:Voltage-gated potassium channel subunit beta-2 n=1 Tax=Caerostris extrusa TaxID=172846 RepID=A0AAV4UPJ8_CAEEX|nr:voltage-gated potassium channel subunit beta-2 [Caerostris extrusa]